LRQTWTAISGWMAKEGPRTELMMIVEPPHDANFWVPGEGGADGGRIGGSLGGAWEADS